MSLNFKITGDDSDFSKKLANVRSEIRNTSDSVSKEGDKMNAMFRNLAIGAASFFTLQQAGSFIKQIATIRGEFQQLEVAFNTMLGSKEASDKLMGQMVDTAAKTPFDLKSMASGAKQLLAYGTAADDVNETLIMLGNVAAGLSIPLGDLVYLYGTTQTQGKVFTMDLRQFMGRGIPLAQELAKELGKTTTEVNEMVTAGKIGFPLVEKVMQNMTSEGGKFYNLMSEQSKTITGQISNLQDAIEVMMNNIGKQNQDTISNVISGVSSIVENYEKVGKVLGNLVLAYGSYKAALISLSVIQKAQGFAENIRLVNMFRKEMGLATAAQQAFNLKVMANPYVAMATAVVAVGVVVAKLAKNYDDLHYSAREAEKAMKESAKETQAKYNSELITLSQLKGQLEGCEKGTAQWVSVRDEIVAKYGQYDENLQAEIDKVGDLSTAYGSLSESLKDFYSRKAFQGFLASHQEMESEVINNNLAQIAKKLKVDKSAEGAELYGRLQQVILGGGSLSKDLQAEISGLGMGVGGAVWDAIHNVWEAQKVYKAAEQEAKKAFGIVDEKTAKLSAGGAGAEMSPIEETANDLKTLVIKIEEAKARLAELRIQSQKGLSGDLRESIGAAETELKAFLDDYSIMTGGDYTAKSLSIVDPNFVIKTQDLFAKAIDTVKEQIKEANADGSLSLIPMDQDAIMQMSDNFNEYLAMFGSYQEKKLAVQRIYNKRIAESADAGEATLLRAQQEAELKGLDDEQFKKLADKGAQASDAIFQVADAMMALAEATGNTKLGDTAEKLGAMGGILQSAGQGLASGGLIGALAGGAASIIQQSVQGFIQAKAQVQAAKLAVEDYYNTLRLNQLTINEEDFESIFGTASIEKATSAYKIAQRSMSEYVSFVANAKGKSGDTGLENMSVLTRSRSGIAKLFGAKDEYTSLKDLAPDLWSGGAFDTEKAKVFLDTNEQINNEQRKQIQNAIDLRDAYDGAMAVIDEQLSGWLGGMANDMADTLWDSVVNGGIDAWGQWQDIGSEAIASIGKQMLSELIMDTYLNSFQDRLKSAYGTADPATAVASVTAEIVNGLPAVLSSATEAAIQFKEKMEAQGIDFSQDAQRSGTTKGLSTASQDTIDELNGRFTVIQGHTYEMNNNVRDLRINSDVIMNNVAEIAGNTRRLEVIETIMANLYANVGDIMLKGITIRN